MDDTADGIALLRNKIGFERLYDGIEPREADRHFFNGEEVIDALVEAVRPRLIIEVGTWMGHSAIHMGRRARSLEPEALTLCVDTWLGSSEHYFNDEHVALLALRHGRPSFYEAFLSNVAYHRLQDGILPLSISSHAGFEILQRLNVKADLIYIDAGHSFDDVKRDVRDYRKLLSDTGVIFGDDYFHPPVKRAVDEYAANHGLHVASCGSRGHKWVLVGSAGEADRLLAGMTLADFV